MEEDEVDFLLEEEEAIHDEEDEDIQEEDDDDIHDKEEEEEENQEEEDEENQEEEEENQEEEDEENQDEEEHQEDEHNQEEEEQTEDVRTFMEFTGFTDGVKVKQYLTATEGNVEEAINLFLSGQPPPQPRQALATLNARPAGGGAGSNSALAHNLLSHLEALAGSDMNRDGGGDDSDQSEMQMHMDALLSNLAEHDVQLGALARSLMLGTAFPEFVRAHQPGGTTSSNDRGLGDEDLYDLDSVKPADAKSRISSSARGQSESLSLIGSNITRSTKNFVTYAEAGLFTALCDALGRPSESLMRVLQVVEAGLMMAFKGLDYTERHTVGWFLPPRMQASSARQIRTKSWIENQFKNQIAPKGDVAGLRRLWRRREIDPAFKFDSGDDVLAVAVSKKAPVSFLTFLINTWGCDPSSKTTTGPLGNASAALGAKAWKTSFSPPPPALSATAVVTMEEDDKVEEDEEYCTKVLELFDSYEPIPVLVATSLPQFTLDSRYDAHPLEQEGAIPEEWRSEAILMDLLSALMNFISHTQPNNAMMRGMEILEFLLNETHSKAIDSHSAWSDLINAALDSTDVSISKFGLSFFRSLAMNENGGDDAILVKLCRSGALFRLMASAESSLASQAFCANVREIQTALVARINGKCSLDGRHELAIRAIQAMDTKSSEAPELLRRALADMTTFEFKCSRMAKSAERYFSGAIAAPSVLPNANNIGINNVVSIHILFETVVKESLLAEDVENQTLLSDAKKHTSSMDHAHTSLSEEDSQDEQEDEEDTHGEDEILDDNFEQAAEGDEKKPRSRGFRNIDFRTGSRPEFRMIGDRYTFNFGKNALGSTNKTSSLTSRNSFSFFTERMRLSSPPLPIASPQSHLNEGSTNAHPTVIERLVELSQKVLAESVPRLLPQVVHDFPGKHDGVKALLNAIPIRLLSPSGILFQESVREFPMHVLPLTPRKDLERHVLRTSVILDDRYKEFCRQLVGKKIALHVSLRDESDVGFASSTSLLVTKNRAGAVDFVQFLVTGYDAKLGAHRLKGLLSHQGSPKQHWRILALQNYTVLERIFDNDETSEITLYDASDLDCPDGGAMAAALWEPQPTQTLPSIDDSTADAIKIVQSSPPAVDGSPQLMAVWWEGDGKIRPGWRLAFVKPALSAPIKEVSDIGIVNDAVHVTFPCMGVIFNDLIRPGSLVRVVGEPRSRLVAGEDSMQIEENRPASPVVRRVSSIQGTQITTSALEGGSGGPLLHHELSDLVKLRDPETDIVFARLHRVGDSVLILSSDLSSLERCQIIKIEEFSVTPFTVKGETVDDRRCKESEVFFMNDENSAQAYVVSLKRVIPVRSIARFNAEHMFAVYIAPGSTANEVPDFSTASAGIGPKSDEGSNLAAIKLLEHSSYLNSPPNSPRLVLGARIEARYAGKSRWYKGHVSRVNADGTYDVAYDDDDTERAVLSSMIQLISSSDSGASAVSAPVAPSSSTAVSFDFRKVFPGPSGRALFDALRREDHVIREEYNFVTRGFEHQPNFYGTFASTLENFGAGAFAQFQTFQQADMLYLRCVKVANELGSSDHVFIRFEPDRTTSSGVMREIINVFARAESNRIMSNTSAVLSPPPPGSRVLLRVGSQAKTQALIDACDASAWTAATLITSYREGLNQGDVSTVSVVTDDGMLFRNVPVDQVKEAPTSVAKPVTAASASSRRIRASEHPPLQNAPGPRFDIPIELTRQFSVFSDSNTNALRHISVTSHLPDRSPYSIEEQDQKQRQVQQMLCAGGIENQPPTISIAFQAPQGLAEAKAIVLAEDENNDDACAFRLLFETLFNRNDPNSSPSSSSTLFVKWDFSSGFQLTWSTSVSFPARESLDLSSSRKRKSSSTAAAPLTLDLTPDDEDALAMLTTLFSKTQGTTMVDWTNPVVSDHFRAQLRDSLSVATRVVPFWVQAFPARAFFLFKEQDRLDYIRCSSLGMSRSLAWIQDDATGYQAKKEDLAQVNSEMFQFLQQNEPNQTKIKRLQKRADDLEDVIKAIEKDRLIGELRQDLVKVDRTNLLRDASVLMEQHAGERSELVVQFVGDTASGVGVTNTFYGAVAADLQNVRVNQTSPMWADPVDAVSRASGGDSELIRPLGLFPQPLLSGTSNDALEANRQIVERFRFLGRLMGQAFLDGKTVPLPLAIDLFELLRDEKYAKRRNFATRAIRLIESDDNSFISNNDRVVDDDEGGTGMIAILRRLVHRIDDDANFLLLEKESALQELRHRLEELDLRFVDPSQLHRKKQVTAAAALNLSSSFMGINNDDSVAIEQQHASSSRAASATDECLQTEIYDNAPSPEAPYPVVLAFVSEWSKRGKSKTQIENALEEAGHSKKARWRVLQATQSSRVINVVIDQGDSSMELVPNGRNVHVNMSNVRDYISAIERQWTGPGIKPVFAAMRSGLADALGERGLTDLLRLFPAEALTRMFCGEHEVKWDENEAMLGFIVPSGEYSTSSPEIRMLVECLKLMNSVERSQFLSFCTALPRIPLSGLPKIKVFPPVKSRVTAVVLSATPDMGASGSESITANGHRLVTGDRVRLAPAYVSIEDANSGPLVPGEVAEATDVHSRAKVKDWWYHSSALLYVPASGELEEGLAENTAPELRQVVASPETWFEEGDQVKTYEARGVVNGWDSRTNTLKLLDANTNRDFKSGKKLTISKHARDRASASPSSFTIRHIVEQCEVVQSPPLLRPKATTCVTTLYLPTGYDNVDHMLRVFREAFEDAKLGGIQDA